MTSPQLWRRKSHLIRILVCGSVKNCRLQLRGGADEKDSDDEGSSSVTEMDGSDSAQPTTPPPIRQRSISAGRYARKMPAIKRPRVGIFNELGGEANWGQPRLPDTKLDSLETMERKELRNKAGRSPFAGKRPAEYRHSSAKRLEELMAESSDEDEDESDEDEGDVAAGDTQDTTEKVAKGSGAEDEGGTAFPWARRAQEREARLQGLMQESSDAQEESEGGERKKMRTMKTSSEEVSEVCTLNE
jgi:hypothetical protein